MSAQAKDALVNVYYSRIKSCRFVYKDGTEAAFVAGQYATDDPVKIAELDAEIKAGHPHLFVDPEKLQVPRSQLDPMEVLKRKIIEEAIAAGEIQKTTSSVSAPVALKPASTANTVNQAQTAEAAAIANLLKK